MELEGHCIGTSCEITRISPRGFTTANLKRPKNVLDAAAARTVVNKGPNLVQDTQNRRLETRDVQFWTTQQTKNTFLSQRRPNLHKSTNYSHLGFALHLEKLQGSEYFEIRDTCFLKMR